MTFADGSVVEMIYACGSCHTAFARRGVGTPACPVCRGLDCTHTATVDPLAVLMSLVNADVPADELDRVRRAFFGRPAADRPR